MEQIKTHSYSTKLVWEGNTGKGTASYSSYERTFSIRSGAKQPIVGSSDPSFRGNPNHHNPEEMLLMAISSCHMLWYLHLCSVNQITVVSYVDSASATMVENVDGSGAFSLAELFPIVEICEEEKTQLAKNLHSEANRMCFIANSCNFPISHHPEIILSSQI